MEAIIEMSKLIADEVRTFNMVNKYGDRGKEYLITVSAGHLYMKESEEAEFGAAQIRENADIHITIYQCCRIPKWRMLLSKWSICSASGNPCTFHIAEI
jgi:hypothetical protein